MSASPWVAPVTLAGNHVRLEPLSPEHAPGLVAAGSDERIWTFMSRGPIRTLEEAHDYVASALAEADAGTQRPFATILLASGKLIGSTRYMDIQACHRGLEIGHTFLHPGHWRTGANTECKLLLLRHAFEELGALRVCLKTDQRNEQSQRAIERLGAVREGVLRRHMIVRDGRVRDTAVYSIIDKEWPAVRERLLARLSGAEAAPGR